MSTMRSELLRHYDSPAPRYTSYPTAPHFTPEVDAARYAAWLAALGDDERLSLYVHIPFCHQLCWFCGCHTQAVRHYEPVKRYIGTLLAEVALVADRLGGPGRVSHLHFGGGSPSMLEAAEWQRLAGQLRDRFAFEEDAEIAVEIDPRRLTAAQMDVLSAFGLTRASIGVQDFDEAVQGAINRVQPYALTRAVVDELRARGVRGLNIDLMYGLPHQTVDSIERTVAQTLSLEPDRIALFGYAHVPWFKRHQQLIDAESLPDIGARLAQFERATHRLCEAGYVWIGLDHFARPDDGLALAHAAGTLRRNFQGYTDDRAAALLGFGASAIGALPQGYVQNATGGRRYADTIARGALAVERGIEVTADDRLRREIIETLMCQCAVDLDLVCRRHQQSRELFAGACEALRPMERDGLVRLAGGRLEITPEGRPAMRAVCAAFDHYLGESPRRHSQAM